MCIVLFSVKQKGSYAITLGEKTVPLVVFGNKTEL